MPKSTKKVAVSKKKTAKPSKVSTSKSGESTAMMMAAVVVVATVVVAPLVWLVTKSLLVLFLIPTVVSVVVAARFKDMTGKEMTQEFRRETTTITSVFAVVLAVLMALNLPKIGLDGRPDTVLPIFMIIYLSLWAIVGVLVTVFLPLGLTIPKKK